MCESLDGDGFQLNIKNSKHTHAHAHTHIYIYIYIGIDIALITCICCHITKILSGCVQCIIRFNSEAMGCGTRETSLQLEWPQVIELYSFRDIFIL